jgi:NADPH2:quinone reductase
MQAACYEHVGPPEVISLKTLPDPSLGPEQVLIRPTWAAVNPIDCYQRGGLVPQPAPWPAIIGCDCAGVVVGVGSAVRGFQVGERVWTTNQGLAGRRGVTADLIAIDECWVYRSPESVDDESLAACGLVGVTCHLGLKHLGQLRAGEVVLVKGAGGAIGSMVIQLAKALGATVIATTSSAEKQERSRSLGADFVFDYRRADCGDQIKAAAPGIDLCWETSRSPNLAESIGWMNEQGRMIVMAGREAQATIPIGPFYVKQLKLMGLVVFKNSATAIRHAADDLNHWLTTGTVQPTIGHRFSWTEAAAAHRLQESMTLHDQSNAFGKILLRID